MKCVQLRFGCGRRHLRFQARNGKDILRIAGIDPQRQPNAVIGPPPETRRHNTDDGMGLIIQAQALAYDVSVASEKALPSFETQDCDRLRLAAGLKIRRLDCAAEQW